MYGSTSQKYSMKYINEMLQWNDSTKCIQVCCGIIPWNVLMGYFYWISSSIPWNHIPWNIGITFVPCGIFQHSFRHQAEWKGRTPRTYDYYNLMKRNNNIYFLRLKVAIIFWYKLNRNRRLKLLIFVELYLMVIP